MKKTLYLVLIIVCFALNLNAQPPHGSMSSDKPSGHGMLIFGTEKVYASHLPLFRTPHNYQIILELELDKTAKQKFISDQKLHPEFTTYTIDPEKFVLPDKIESKGSFKANLYRGHFERGGTKIADSIQIKIASVIYLKKFNEAETKPVQSTYLLFGNTKEQFAVHQITNKPDFEQIILVKTTLGRNLFEPAIFADSNSPVGISGNTISVGTNSVVLLKQIYLEFDDLKD
jgi:hypothetical protein